MWQPEQKAGEDEAANLLLRCTRVLKGFAALVCEINALAIKPFLSSQSFIETEICYKVQILWQGAMKDQDFLSHCRVRIAVCFAIMLGGLPHGSWIFGGA